MTRRNNKHILFVVPALLVYGLVMIFPIGFTFFFSLWEWERLRPIAFGTLEHFTRLASDPILGRAFLNNFLYIAYTIVLEGFTGLILAGMARRMRRSLGFRAVFFAPVILPSIVIGTLWRQMYGTSGGLLNGLLSLAGIDPVVWLAPPLTMLSVSVVSGWTFAGYFMTIFYASMARIPRSIMDSSVIDGAGPWRTFFQIEVPLVKNVVVIVLVIITTGGFKAFDLFQILLRRDPLNSGIVLPTHLIRTFFENQDIGYGSALSVLLTAVVVAFLVIINTFGKRVTGEIDEY
jgi:raffinose/stachyose/melibiose transport system permease protein